MRFGRYETLRAIAVGGMAKVYLGRALGAGGFERLVAIKVMHGHLAADPEFVAMFLDEARLAARIRHPNVVATQDVVQADEGVLIVMDWVDGPPLSTVIKALVAAGERFPMDVALRIFLDVLAGLHAAHELTGADGAPLGLVHRDVSPQNVLVGKDGVARITDFGVAHAQARLTVTPTGKVKGKMAYVAPEQIVAGKIDRRGDVYAAGVVLWEMLAGRRLFRATTDHETVSRILSGRVESPRALDAEIPVAVEAACLRALSTDPNERFATALAFADALEAAAAGAGITVASAKSVSAFITAIGAEELEEAQRERIQSVPPPAPGAAALPAPLGAVAPQIATQPSTATAPGAAVTQPPPPARRNLWIALALGAVGVAVAAAFFVSGGRPDAAAARPAGSAPIVAAPPTPSVHLLAPAPAPSVAPAATAAASAPPEVGSARTRAVAPAPARPAGDAHKTRPAATAYRPSEL